MIEAFSWPLPAAGLFWLGWVVVWLVAQAARFRLPAPLFFVAPFAVLVAGGASSWFAFEALETSLRSLPLPDVPDARRTGTREALLPVQYALWGVAWGAAMSAVVLAVGNILRAGDDGRWTWRHALAALPVLFLTPIGLWAGLDVFVIGALSASAVGLASLRLGKKADARRMVGGRVLVTSLGVLAALTLAIAHALDHRLDTLAIWTGVPYLDQPAALAGLGDPVAAVTSALGMAALLVFAGVLALLPVGRLVLDARSGAGFVLTALWVVPMATALVPALRPLADVRAPNPMRERRLALEKLGIVLPLHAANAPWRPGTHLMVGLYWANTDARRVLPFRDGLPSPDDGGQALDSVLTAALGNGLILESDYRIDGPRLLPILRRAHTLGHDEVCFVVQDATGQMGCQLVGLGTGRDFQTHLLVQPEELVVIQDAVATDASMDRLGDLPGPLAVHFHDDLPGERMWTVLGSGVPSPALIMRP